MKYILYTLLFVIILILLYYTLFRTNENLTDVERISSVIQTVDDPFTGLSCIDSNLPAFRYYTNPDQTETLRCLVNPKTNNCYNVSELFDPKNVPACDNFNNALVKTVRDVNSATRKIFNGLTKTYSVQECSSNALKNNSHWCGKVYSAISKVDCSDPFKNQKTCMHTKNLENYTKKESKIADDTTSYNFSLSKGADCMTKTLNSFWVSGDAPKVTEKGKSFSPIGQFSINRAGADPTIDPSTINCSKFIITSRGGNKTVELAKNDCADVLDQYSTLYNAYEKKLASCLKMQ